MSRYHLAMLKGLGWLAAPVATLKGLGWWWDSTKWYAFQAWRQGATGWKIVHQEGPSNMTRSQAQSRQVDLMEENWGGTVYVWEWTGTRYVRAF